MLIFIINLERTNTFNGGLCSLTVSHHHNWIIWGEYIKFSIGLSEVKECKVEPKYCS